MVIFFVSFFDSNLFPLCIGFHRSNWCKIANMNKVVGLVEVTKIHRGYVVGLKNASRS
jgi:hypothetical protein